MTASPLQRSRARRRATAALAAAASVTALAAGPAHATPPQPVTIAVHGHVTGPDTVQGTWEASGAFTDFGTYTEHFRFAGTNLRTVHVEKVLVGTRGTFVLRADARVTWAAPTLAQFRHGSWRISSGTGAYGDLHAEGTPATTPESFADTATGVVEIEHAGRAH